MDEIILRALGNRPGAPPGYFNDSEMKRLTTLVECGEVIVRYADGVPYYYLPEQVEFCDDVHKVPLAARLHEDGTIHVCFNGNDVGIKISPDKDNENVVFETDDDELWLVKSSEIGKWNDRATRMESAIRDIISKQIDYIETLEAAAKDEKFRLMLRENVSTWVCKIDELEHTIRQKNVRLGTLEANAKVRMDVNESLREQAESDSVAWKKREADLLEMIVARDSDISAMNAVLIAVGDAITHNQKVSGRDVFPGRDHRTLGQIVLMLFSARCCGVYTDAD